MRLTGAPRILVIEDDLAVREGVTATLRAEGYLVQAEPDGTRIASALREFNPDLAVLDVRLPTGPSGLSLAHEIRQVSEIPIIFLTAADTVDDRLSGFQAGADDYLVKPFALAELLARIRALLKRSGRALSNVRQVSDLLLDESAHQAVRNGTEIELTRTEFRLLTALARTPGRVFSKVQLLTEVWGFEAYDPNLVEVHMSSLRRKLEQHGPRLIHTVRGVGYVLRP